ncbi:mechanosensitive ion channel family protein [Marinicellulosiphila megalodicopiae]|uniref:mechanosensitive ion channel family protein n=1 Tax=Marinicellulosiphila megalodicopiae TaxID=2724896 RepID=UPI003BB062A8
MFDFLSQTYYGNTIQSWIISLSLIVLSVLLGKIIYWAFSKFVRIFTNKSKGKLDDIIVDMVEEPAVFMVIVVGFWFALNQLVLSETFSKILSNAYQVIVALLIGWLLSRLFDALYNQYIIPFTDKTESDLDDQLAPILSKGVKLIIWTMAIIIGLNNAGYDVAALIAGLGIGGLALAMAAKDTVSNVFGGFTIFTDKPFRIQDRIKIAGYDGTVIEIGVRSTRLKTLEGRIVTIPNAKFSDAPVENITLEPSRKVVLNLGLTYDTQPEKIQQALEILTQINTQNASTEENSIVSFNGFGDFSLNVMFIYYITKGQDIAKTQSAINLSVLTQFNAAKLEFAFPTQTLFNIEQK